MAPPAKPRRRSRWPAQPAAPLVSFGVKPTGARQAPDPVAHLDSRSFASDHSTPSVPFSAENPQLRTVDRTFKRIAVRVSLPSTISGRSAIGPRIRSCSTTSPIGSSATAGRSRSACASWSSAARSAWPAPPRPRRMPPTPTTGSAPDARPPAGGRGHPRRDPGRLRPARGDGWAAPASRSI